MQPLCVSHAAIAGLVAADLVPLMGVLCFNWSLFSVLYFLWTEATVVILFAFARLVMALRRGATIHPSYIGLLIVPPVFLTVYFGVIFTETAPPELRYLDTDSTSGWVVLKAIWKAMIVICIQHGEWPSTVALLAAHGLAWVQGLSRPEGRGELVSRVIEPLLVRLIVTQIAFVGGGYALHVTRAPAWLLVILLGLKIPADAIAQWRAGAGSAGEGEMDVKT